MLDRLDRCLRTLTPDERRLVLSYYGNGRHEDRRRQLAIALGITPTTLRVRAHRLRQRLQQCALARE
jgi:DNA-directed RNA polymerase specialized sigma24 family protein